MNSDYDERSSNAPWKQDSVIAIASLLCRMEPHPSEAPVILYMV